MESLVFVRQPAAFLSVSTSPLSRTSRRKGAAGIDDRVSRRPQRVISLVAALDTETASTSSSEPADQQGPPRDLLDFQPEVGSEAQTLSVQSGEKNLRNFMIGNKLELYGLYVRTTQRVSPVSSYCVGCLRFAPPKAALKPESWRLACQTVIGGKVVVRGSPQNKKT